MQGLGKRTLAAVRTVAATSMVFMLGCTFGGPGVGVGSIDTADAGSDESGDEGDEPGVGDPGDRTADETGDSDDGEETATELPESDRCTPQSKPAPTESAPADIIIVVDNSGSMEDEAGAVQQHINALWQQVVDAGVDARIVLISSYPGQGSGMCVPPPLGIGGCPRYDDNRPLFTHVGQQVGSRDALLQVLGHHSVYQGMLREEATKHVVVVSDDDTELKAVAFDEAFRSLGEAYESYVFHGVVALHDCSSADAVGHEYIQLTHLTDGVLAELCNQTVDLALDQVAADVIDGAPVGCAFEIPVADGMLLDPSAVNVAYDDGDELQTLGFVQGRHQCAEVDDGWFYEAADVPSRIRLCPQTCNVLGDIPDVEIDVRFGCDTEPAT